MALDCFGRYNEVVKIYGQGDDIEGKAYVCYYTKFGSNGSKISHSYKESELVRHCGTSRKYTSHQLDVIEADMNSWGEIEREELF